MEDDQDRPIGLVVLYAGGLGVDADEIGAKELNMSSVSEDGPSGASFLFVVPQPHDADIGNQPA